MQLNVIILRNELEEDHILWIKACEEYKSKVRYSVVNLSLNNWLEQIRQQDFDILLAKPGGLTAQLKQLYDEIIYILGKVLGYRIFPSPEEIFIYENKRFLSYWLSANNIPHPATYVFYDSKSAMEFAENNLFPLVAKTNIGASGSGVIILHSKEDSQNYIKHAFSNKGASRRIGPNLAKEGLIRRGFQYIINPAGIQKKLNLYKAIRNDVQTDFVIFQEYIEHDFEWRVVRIGESFFAHKKLKAGDKASGSLRKKYENPPFELLDFVKTLTDKHQFYSQAIDIFESPRGYLVNEMQCMFGQSDPYQMLVDGKPGRYRSNQDKWHFEDGDWARNGCYNLRIEHLIHKIAD